MTTDFMEMHGDREGSDDRAIIGGIARIGYGMLPAEMILTEHYAIGSQMAILSRSFCNANHAEDPESIREDFMLGVRKIREKEAEIKGYSETDFAENYEKMIPIVAEIASQIRAKRA